MSCLVPTICCFQATTGTSISDLPLTVLVSILQQLSLQHRLGTCTLVNTAWAQATRMSVTDVCRAPDAQVWDNSLQPWLDRCSGSSYLTSLDLSIAEPDATPTNGSITHPGAGKPEQQGKDPPPINIRFLPQQLVKLDVQGCSFRTDYNVTAAGNLLTCPLAALTGLIHLSVADCRMSAASVDGLAKMTTLQQLGLSSVVPTSYDALCHLADVLPTLQQLTHLQLHGDVGSLQYSQYRRYCGNSTRRQQGSDRTAAAAINLPSSDHRVHQPPVKVCKLHGDVHVLQGLCHLSAAVLER